MWVQCLKEVGTNFVHLHGMSISEPYEINSAWAESYPSGAPHACSAKVNVPHGV
jgi:hypothetical protein